jgi:hypothetical protein
MSLRNRISAAYVLSEDRLYGLVCDLEFLATDAEVWARFPALPDFLRSYLKEKVAAPA